MDWISVMDNKQLGLNMFKWASGKLQESDSIPPESTPPEDGGICMGKRKIRTTTCLEHYIFLLVIEAHGLQEPS